MSEVKTRLFNVRLPDDIHKKLKKEAEARNMTMNGLINFIVYQFLNNK